MPQHYEFTATSPRPRTDVFDWLVDLRHATEWYGAASSVVLEGTDDPRAIGARFRVRSGWGPVRSTLVYELAELEAPDRVVWRYRHRVLEGTDAFHLRDAGDGRTEVRYTSDFTYRHVYRALSPLAAQLMRPAIADTRERLAAALA